MVNMESIADWRNHAVLSAVYGAAITRETAIGQCVEGRFVPYATQRTARYNEQFHHGLEQPLDTVGRGTARCLGLALEHGERLEHGCRPEH